MLKKVIKWIVLLSIVVIGGCCSGTQSSVQTQYANDIMTLETDTIAIVSLDEDKDLAVHCAGVWVSRDTIVTAAHCIENPAFSELTQMLGEDFVKKFMPNISTAGNDVSYLINSDVSNISDVGPTHSARLAKVLFYDKGKDIAVLQAKGNIPDHTIAKISRDQVYVGENVHIMGHKVGYWWSYSRGYVAQVRIQSGPTKENVKVIQIDGTVWLGNSGGGAFNEKGELIGLCAYVDNRGPGLSFFIHRDIILNALVKANALR